ncbi:MAG: DoxX family protein [Ignavibacteriae bacterium]|nr:DoxX family protein [Ignavibacteriota bacterium]
MEILFLIGRIIFGGYFIFNGLNHFLRFTMMKDYTKMKGVPFPSAAVVVTGFMLLLGGLSIMTGVYPDIGILLLITSLIPVSFTMHNFWKVEDAQIKMMEMVNFTKNLALVGAVLMMLALSCPWPLSLQ